METIKVGTFNVKDHYQDIFYNGIDKEGNDNANTLAHYLLENDIDLLGTQELVRGYIKRLQDMLPHYKLVGEYRQGKEKKISMANETNSIITSHRVLYTNTEWLPYKQETLSEKIKYLLDTMPRIVTTAVVEIPQIGRICMFNTHLDYKNTKIQYKQLRKIYELLNEFIKIYPLVLTGDFNASVENRNFKDFINALSKQGIYRVPNDITTHTRKVEPPIDHIFLSDDLILENIILGDKRLDKTSDHKVLIAEIKRK